MTSIENAASPFIQRHAQTGVLEALRDTPAVLINGPRQSGKTTLTQQCLPEVPYLSLDDATQLAAARADPQGFVRRLDRAIIDEVQRAPELLLALKLAIDQDRRPGRFLLTGSANVMSLPTIADSLAGRIEIHTLLPLSSAEIAGRDGQFLARASNQDWAGLDVSGPVGDDFVAQVLAGGYPEMRQRSTPARRQAWARAYITTLVERDIQDVARIEEAARLPELLAILSTLTGQLLNLSQLGGQIGLNLRTAEKYVGILEKLFLVRRLPAWSRNELGRLIKTPKLHFIDAGLQGALSRTSSELLARDRQRMGPLLESWVFGELLKAISEAEDAWFLSHYRDKDQVEVDFVLESPLRKVIGIEVKAAASVAAADFKGLRRLRDQCAQEFISGIVLYDGESVVPFGDGLWAIPFGSL
jgi:predicted AAA+ superfamily ATPase